MPYKCRTNDIINWRDKLWCVFEVEGERSETDVMLLRSGFMIGEGYYWTGDSLKLFKRSEVERTAYKHGVTDDPLRKRDELVARSRC